MLCNNDISNPGCYLENLNNEEILNLDNEEVLTLNIRNWLGEEKISCFLIQDNFYIQVTRK